MQANKKFKKLVLFIVFISNLVIAQDVNVEKSTYGLQTGFLGVWAHNESKIFNQIALRSEIGFDFGIFGGDFYPKTGFLMTPVITLEPRWYYNLNKRNSKSKNISGNSGNFLTIKSSFHPNWFVISNYDNVKIVNQVSIIPTWGIKRNIGSHFTFETGLGIGYAYYFAKSEGYSKDFSSVAVNLHLRLGYRFSKKN